MNRRDCLGLLAGGALAGCAGLRPAPRQHFVLVHGAWHGSWCWEKLTPLLRAQGHTVTAVDLPRTPTDKTTLSSYVRHIGAVLDQAKEPVVLVGHSLGGMAISAVAEERPENIRTLVFLTAFVMADGEPALSRADPDNKVTPVLLLDFRPGTKIPYQMRLDPSKPEGVKLAFYNDCSDADARAAMARLVIEPLGPMMEKMRLTPGRFGRVDKAYVFCSDDNAITLKKQREYAAKWPMRKTVTLKASHSPFMSMPERLADALAEVTA